MQVILSQVHPIKRDSERACASLAKPHVLELDCSTPRCPWSSNSSVQLGDIIFIMVFVLFCVLILRSIKQEILKGHPHLLCRYPHFDPYNTSQDLGRLFIVHLQVRTKWWTISMQTSHRPSHLIISPAHRDPEHHLTEASFEMLSCRRS